MTHQATWQVMKSTGKTVTKFNDQDFFQDFNWTSFIPGDIIWLENYQGKDGEYICGIFKRIDNNQVVIRIVPNHQARILARNESSDIRSYSSYWNRYLAS